MSKLDQVKSLLNSIDDIYRTIKDLEEAIIETGNQIEKLSDLKENTVKKHLMSNLKGKLEDISKSRETAQTNLTSAQGDLYHLCSSLKSDDLAEDLVNTILKFVYKYECLNLLMIQYALFSSSCEALQIFCNYESKFIYSELYSDDFVPSSFFPKFLFVDCALRKKHFLTFIYDKIYKGHDIEYFSFAKSLPLLASLERWTNSDRKWEECSLLQDTLEKYSQSSDGTLTYIAKEKIQNIMITKSCLQNYSFTKARHLLNLLNHHSVLYAIRASLPFHKIPYQKVMNLLSSDFLNNQNNKLNEECTATYQAYFALSLTLQIINKGIEMDREVHIVQSKRAKSICKPDLREKYIKKLVEFYSKIVTKWKKVKEIVNSLTLLELRLEVLENIYSLLFIKHTHISDMDESIVDEGEDQISPNSLILEDANESNAKSKFHKTSDSLSSEIRIESSFESSECLPFTESRDNNPNTDPITVEHVSSPTPGFVKDLISTPSETHSESSSSPNLRLVTSLTSDLSSSSSIGDFSRCGYLINTLIAWDLLLFLRDALVTLQADCFAQFSKMSDEIGRKFPDKEFTERRSFLSSTVTEALWRMHVGIPIQRSLGSTDEISLYLDGKLASNESFSVVYQSESSDKEKKSAGSRKLFDKRISAPIQVFSHFSVTDFLLSSPGELFNLALINGNLTQARQVLAKYNLLGGPEEQELLLSENLSKFLPRLEEYSNLKPKVDKLRKTNTAESGIDRVRSIIKEDSSNIAKSSLINEIVNLSNSHCNTDLKRSTDVISIDPKIVLLEIVLTSHLTEDDAAKLFVSANVNSTFHSNIDTESTKALNRGIKKCQELVNIYKHFEKMKDYKEKSLLECLVPSRLNPRQILLSSSIPINSKKFEASYDAWLVLLRSLTSFEKLWIKSSVTKSLKSNKAINDAYKEVLRLANYHLPPELAKLKLKSNVPYLAVFYDYMKLLNKELKRHSKLYGDKKAECYFDLLNSRPVTILGNVMFQEFVSPFKLEELASKMKIDLLSLILSYALPPLSFSWMQETHLKDNLDELSSLGCCQWGNVWILNAGPLACSKPTNGSIVARDILISLLDSVKDAISVDTDFPKMVISDSTGSVVLRHAHIRDILKETSEIASTNLHCLKPGIEALSFFINITNLVYLHSSILNSLLFGKDDCGLFSSSELERCLACQRVGYLIGELGFISLSDLLYLILKLPINTPKSCLIGHNKLENSFDSVKEEMFTQLLPSTPLETIFSISQVGSHSPKIQVIYVDAFEEETNVAVTDYITFVAQNCSPVSGKCSITRTLLNYLRSQPSGWDKAVDKLSQLADVDCHSYIQMLKKTNGNVEHLSLTQDNEFHLVLEYSELCSTKVRNKDSSVTESACANWEYVAVPDNVRGYLKAKSPFLSAVVDIFGIVYKSETNLTEDDLSMLLNDKHDIAMCQPLIKALTLPQLRYFPHKVDKEAKFNNVLNYLPNLRDIYENLENIYSTANQKEITKNQRAFLLLESVPSLMFDDHCELVQLRDRLVLQLASCPPSSENVEPWGYFYKATASSRINIAKKFHKNWPVKESIEILRYLSCDYSITPEDRCWAKRRMHQIQIYNQIVNLSNLNFVSWQEVDHLSLSDPSQVLKSLINESRFGLSVEWLNSHPLFDGITNLNYHCRLLHSLNNDTPNFDDAESNLRELQTEGLVCVMQAILESINVPATRKFLLEFFLEHVTPNWEELVEPNMSPYFNEFLIRQELIGLTIYEMDRKVTSSECQLRSLVKHPYLIFEQLLMNLKLDFLHKAIPIIKPLLKSVVCRSKSRTLPLISKIDDQCLCIDHLNDLVENYSSKALEMSGIEVSLKDSINPEVSQAFVIPQHVPLRAHWQVDSSVKKCPVCDETSFSIFFRRHHCRRCGRVVCGDCSKNRLLIPGYQDVPVRVCRDCYFNLTNVCDDDSVPLRKDSGNLTSQDNNDGPSHGIWYLSVDDHHNTCVRKEFTYDSTPSFNLCQTIMLFHTDDMKAAICVLKFCLKLFKSFIQSFGSVYSELDPHFLLKIIRSLISFAKLRFLKVNHFDGTSLCDYLDQWMTFIKLLSKSNCLHLISRDCLVNILTIGEISVCCDDTPPHIQEFRLKEFKFVRNLRDKLVKFEKWELALDISTKAGLEVSGVWGAKGMAFLKSGDFVYAREYFAKSISKTVDKHITNQSPLLKEIINFFENHAPLSAVQLRNSSPSCLMLTEAPFIVLEAINSLSAISNGSLGKPLTVTEENSSNSPLFDDRFQDECEYYLKTYGCHRMYLQFLIRHKRVKDSLAYSKENKINTNVFNEEILVPSLRKGEFDQLLSHMKSLDTEAIWYPSVVFSSCQWLESSHQYHSLLHIEECLEDRIRAAITLIRIYFHTADSFTSLTHHKHHLQRAAEHLKNYLNDLPLQPKPNNEIPKSVLQSPIWERWKVNKHLSFIEFQIDAAKFLSISEIKQTTLKPLINSIRVNINATLIAMDRVAYRVPTVFKGEDRLVLAIACICAGSNFEEGLNLACRLIEMNSVEIKEFVYYAPLILLEQERSKDVHRLIKSVVEWGLWSREKIIEFFSPVIIHLGKNFSQSIFEEFVIYIEDDSYKIEAYLATGRLKSAYILIAQKNDVEGMKKLLAASKKLDQSYVSSLCTKWIQGREKRTK